MTTPACGRWWRRRSTRPGQERPIRHAARRPRPGGAVAGRPVPAPAGRNHHRRHRHGRSPSRLTTGGTGSRTTPAPDQQPHPPAQQGAADEHGERQQRQRLRLRELRRDGKHRRQHGSRAASSERCRSAAARSATRPRRSEPQPAGLVTWGVARGAPRKHMNQASAVLTVGTLTETYDPTLPAVCRSVPPRQLKRRQPCTTQTEGSPAPAPSRRSATAARRSARSARRCQGRKGPGPRGRRSAHKDRERAEAKNPQAAPTLHQQLGGRQLSGAENPLAEQEANEQAERAKAAAEAADPRRQQQPSGGRRAAADDEDKPKAHGHGHK
jgi:hypothetical protein